MKKSNVHVVPRSDGQWGVRVAGNQKSSSVHKTQAEAISAGRGKAIASKSEMLIHRQNGRIRERNSYGNDPYPPKG